MVLTIAAERIIDAAVRAAESNPAYVVSDNEARAIAQVWQPRGDEDAAMSRVARGVEFDPVELLNYVDVTVREQDCSELTGGMELVVFRGWAESAVIEGK